MSKTPSGPSAVSMTLEVLPLSAPPSAAAPTLSRCFSPLVSAPPEPVVSKVPINKSKAIDRIGGAAQRRMCVRMSRINLDIYNKLKEMEEDRKGRGRLKDRGYNLCQEGTNVDRGGRLGGKEQRTLGKEDDSSAYSVESGVRG